MRTFKYKQRPADVGIHKYVNNDCVDRQQGWEDKGKEGRENDRTDDGRTDGRKEGKSKEGWMETLRSEGGRKAESDWKEVRMKAGRTGG